MLYIKIFLTTLYVIKFDVRQFFYGYVHYHATAKSNTLPLDNRETPTIVLLSFVLFSYTSL